MDAFLFYVLFSGLVKTYISLILFIHLANSGEILLAVSLSFVRSISISVTILMRSLTSLDWWRVS